MTTNPILRGMGWMGLSGLCFAAMTAAVKLAGPDLPAAVAAFVRYGFGMLLSLPILWRIGIRVPEPRILAFYGLRGALHATGVILWFYAITRIPLAEVTAIGYTAPIFTTIGAALFFAETIYVRRILAIAAGFAGMLLIVRPGIQEVNPGQLAQLCAAPLFAAGFLLVKKLAATEAPAMIVVMLNVVCLIVLTPLAIVAWRTPDALEAGWLLAATAAAMTGHYCQTKAYQVAPITATQPVAYLQLVWATLIGLALFAERPDLWVLAGGAVILASTTYIAHRERALARQPRD